MLGRRIRVEHVERDRLLVRLRDVHVGRATMETRTAMGDLQVENLHLHFAGKPVKTPVV